jgi:hypothetical protein
MTAHATESTHAQRPPPKRERRAAPRLGDIVASRRTARADVYAISIVHAEGRATVARYAEAIETVRSLARQLRVDGWYTADHTHHARVANHRP